MGWGEGLTWREKEGGGSAERNEAEGGGGNSEGKVITKAVNGRKTR